MTRFKTARISRRSLSLIRQLEAEAVAAQASLAYQLQLVSSREPPLRPGSIVTSSRGKRMVITSVVLRKRHTRSGSVWEFAARGPLLKKNGHTSKRFGDAFWRIVE